MSNAEFAKAIKLHAKHVAFGTLLAIDPGSTSPGYAVFHAGILTVSGVFKLPVADIAKRLQHLADVMLTITPVPPDAMAVERIRGHMAHEYLRWAVGVHIGGARTHRIIEVPIHQWQALRKREGSTIKSDESDAIYIGRAAILAAQEYLDEHS